MSFPGQDEAARTAGGQRPAALLHRGHPAQHRREPAVAAGTQKSLKPRETGADKKKEIVTEKKIAARHEAAVSPFFFGSCRLHVRISWKKKDEKDGKKREKSSHNLIQPLHPRSFLISSCFF